MLPKCPYVEKRLAANQPLTAAKDGMLAELREMLEGAGEGSEFPHYHEIMAQIKKCRAGTQSQFSCVNCQRGSK